jgi:hypothetical protein
VAPTVLGSLVSGRPRWRGRAGQSPLAPRCPGVEVGHRLRAAHCIAQAEVVRRAGRAGGWQRRPLPWHCWPLGRGSATRVVCGESQGGPRPAAWRRAHAAGVGGNITGGASAGEALADTAQPDAAPGRPVPSRALTVRVGVYDPKTAILCVRAPRPCLCEGPGTLLLLCLEYKRETL